jgi:hypothetical protein
LFGLFLGFLSLAHETVREATVAPDPSKMEEGTVLYHQGSSAGGAAWRSKRGAFLAQSVNKIILSEGDLNQWSKSELIPVKEKAVNGDKAAEKPGLFSLDFANYNFRIGEDFLQIGGYLSFPRLLPGDVYICQVRGRFVEGKSGPEFKIYEGYIGKAPIGNVPAVRLALEKLILRGLHNVPEAEEIRNAWPTFESAQLEGGQLVLQRS